MLSVLSFMWCFAVITLVQFAKAAIIAGKTMNNKIYVPVYVNAGVVCSHIVAAVIMGEKPIISEYKQYYEICFEK